MVFGASTTASKKTVVGDSETAVLTRAEVERMKSFASGAESPTHSASLTATSPEANRARRAQLAAERRTRMVAMDEERRAKGGVRPIEDIEKEARRQEDGAIARKKLDEDIDEVKYMNQVMLYAKCVTVRDAQILEKQSIKAESAEDERRMDMAMELERLKALRMYEERELKRIEDRKKGAAVIRAQIEEREQERLRRIELKQQEQEAMIHHIDRMKADDRLESVKKKDGAKRLMEDVALANAEQIRLKNRQREMEQEEERQIADYIKDKERRDQEVLDEQRRIKADKEMEIARLRSKQEKAQDKQAELDALRARRAQEAYDRDWRQKEKDAASRAAAINADLNRARETQMREREYLLSDQARQEKEEFERIIAVQKLAEAAEREKRDVDTAQRRKNAAALAKQISEVEEARKKTRRDFLEEGAHLKMEKRERDATIDTIRVRKLRELEELDVPKQYRSEMMKKKSFEPLRPSGH
jgi:hypothetical protein